MFVVWDMIFCNKKWVVVYGGYVVSNFFSVARPFSLTLSLMMVLSGYFVLMNMVAGTMETLISWIFSFSGVCSDGC